MILWTVQHAVAGERLYQYGILRGDGRRVDPYFRHAFHWIADEMRRRLPPSHAKFPIWGWYRWQGEARARPDLRTSGHLAKGTPGICIEFEVPDNRVLLSDFDAWHCVLNGSFLSLSEEEDNAFDEELEKAGVQHGWPYPEPFNSRVISSWQRIFNMEAADPEWRGSPSERGIQATFWELNLSQVRCINRFTAR